ncbi:hypothetical protein sos41_20490 [Alphaproteobacteria bacterium SO-S41]|nr:hypothetical protein sos41_20490 [Alphaproteobacteria bacterium SO-S41]
MRNQEEILIVGAVIGFIILVVIIGLVRARQAPKPVLATGLTDNAMENLESAKALFDQGAITKSEFERLKAKALGIEPPVPAAATATQQGAFSNSGMEQIENAKALLDQGVITQSEFERLKGKILSG